MALEQLLVVLLVKLQVELALVDLTTHAAWVVLRALVDGSHVSIVSITNKQVVH